MNKTFLKSTVLSLFIFQASCSMPTTTPSNSNTQTNSVTSVVIENSLILTQKDDKGIVNPVVPEDVESFTIDGKVVKSSEFQISEEAFSTKSDSTSSFLVRFSKGKFIFSSKNNSNFSFKLKNSLNSIVIPSSDLNKSNGNLRIELSKNDSGEVIGLIGGKDDNGKIDNSNNLFSLDLTTKTFTVTQPDGNQTKYSFDGNKITSENSQADKTKSEEDKATAKKVLKLSSVSPFVGNWKYSSLGINVNLSIKDAGSNKIGYSTFLESSLTSYKGSFNGNVDYSSTTDVNSLNISSSINGKNLKGNIQLSGDNSLTLVLNSSDETDIKSFIGVPVTLKRDVK